MTIDFISTAIKNAFVGFRNPVNVIPAMILVCSLFKRPGLSPTVSSANVISKLDTIGAVSGKMPDGTENIMNGLIFLIFSELFRAIREDMSIQIVIPPLGANVQTTGANAAGTVISTGGNAKPITGTGVAR